MSRILFLCSSTDGFHVSVQVIARVCQLLQIPSLDAGKLKPWKIPALKDLQYITREVNVFIEVWHTCLLTVCLTVAAAEGFFCFSPSVH